MKYVNRIALLLALSFIFLNASAQPVNIWVWDNDNGAKFLNPDVLVPNPLTDSMGCEANIVSALQRLGYSPVTTAFFIDPSIFDAAFITNGWRDLANGTLPGIVNNASRDAIKFFMDSGKPVFMEGCDLGWTYMGDTLSADYDTTFMRRYFGTRLVADQSMAPVDSLHGIDGTPFAGLHYFYAPFNFDSNNGPRSSVDVIDTVSNYGNAQPIFYSTPDSKWSNGRAISYSDYYKGNVKKSVLFSFILGACRDFAVKDKQTVSDKNEIIRQTLRFFSIGNSLYIYPAPISGFTAQSRVASIILKWALSPDSLVTNYEIYRSAGDTTNLSYLATVPQPVDSFIDNAIIPDTAYWYTIKAITAQGDTSRRSHYAAATVTGINTIANDLDKPLRYCYYSQGIIYFNLDKAGAVQVILYNITGQKIEDFTPGYMKSGNCEYRIITKRSGVYICNISMGQYKKYLKILIFR